MAENRRYYWLKLKEDFFTDKRIKRLRRISGGDTYTIIYLKLLLLSLKDGGKLYYDGVETDFIKELALTIDEKEDDVMVTVNYLMAQNLIEVIAENDEYFLTEMPNLIGSETASTRRSRKSRAYKENQKALQCNTNATLSNLLQQNCNTEIEKEIDIELEIKREGEIKTEQTAPAPFGRYENVFLSERELAELQEELPGKWEYYIDRLSGYIASSGKKYKNHAATIRRWAADDRAKGKPKKGIPDYSYKEGESL